MTRKVVFHAGNQIGQSDDSYATAWDDDEESRDELMKRALLWSANHWPESDGDYAAVVWIEDEDGLLESEDVTIGAGW